ncbi:serine hydrolase domain-containing protein [Nonomuraea sp. NPDC005650]|uniref:serine hydrolase domain-containing protein n=1 Tax=Nonomuraea sp. NPDC005650 TaxID=3157045 RepID=UPI0033BE4A34
MNHTAKARLACAALTLAITASPAASPAGSPATAATPEAGDLQQALDALARTGGVVGTIGELYVDGRRVGRGSAGSRLLDGKGGRVPADSRYRIGSQTKRLTATVVLQLVEEGRLGLEDKLSDLLPEVASQDAVERADEITVRQLIRHMSGIPNWFTPDLVDIYDFTTYYSPMELVKKSRTQPRTGEPGEKYFYSNTNYMLLGMIIEKLTGRSLGAEFARRLFVPLGMSRTYLPVRPPEGIKGPHGHGYSTDAEGKVRDMHRLNASYGYAAGGVISTAHDLSAFDRAFYQGKLLPPALQKLIADPPESAPTRPPLCGGDPELRANAGGTAGFTAVTFSSTDGRIQFATSTTTSDQDPAVIGQAVSQAAEAVLCPGE